MQLITTPLLTLWALVAVGPAAAVGSGGARGRGGRRRWWVTDLRISGADLERGEVQNPTHGHHHQPHLGGLAQQPAGDG